MTNVDFQVLLRVIYLLLCPYRDLPGGFNGKEYACSVGEPGSIPGWEDALEKEWLPTPVFRGAWRTMVPGVTKS